MQQEGQELLHDVDSLRLAVGLKTLVLEIENTLLANTPQNKGNRAGGLGQGALPVFLVPLGFDTHLVTPENRGDGCAGLADNFGAC